MAGKIVKTKSGKIGKTKNEDKIINASSENPKVLVYLEDGTKIVASQYNLEFIGYWD